ncbi:hypothetical protein QT971_17365 [Microcoleus sp. herbarium19]|uniref:hypothetical protein n=1 Tax=unclassified Microcoleus TaxID=2642155 RepID=UPI002FD4A15B
MKWLWGGVSAPVRKIQLSDASLFRLPSSIVPVNRAKLPIFENGKAWISDRILKKLFDRPLILGAS